MWQSIYNLLTDSGNDFSFLSPLHPYALSSNFTSSYFFSDFQYLQLSEEAFHEKSVPRSKPNLTQVTDCVVNQDNEYPLAHVNLVSFSSTPLSSWLKSLQESEFSVCDGRSEITQKDKETKKKLITTWKTLALSEILFTVTIRIYEWEFVHYLSNPKFTRPRLLVNNKIDFGILQPGAIVGKYISLRNPKSVPVYVHVVFEKTMAKDGALSLPLDNTFFLAPEYSHCVLLQPGVETEIGPILFSPALEGEFATKIFVKNNLSIFETVYLTGSASPPEVKLTSEIILSGLPKLSSLLFSLDSDTLCSEDFLFETVPIQTLMQISNVGNSSVDVFTFYVASPEHENPNIYIVDAPVVAFTLPPGAAQNVSLNIQLDSFILINKSFLSMETNAGVFSFPILEELGTWIMNICQERKSQASQPFYASGYSSSWSAYFWRFIGRFNTNLIIAGATLLFFLFMQTKPGETIRGFVFGVSISITPTAPAPDLKDGAYQPPDVKPPSLRKGKDYDSSGFDDTMDSSDYSNSSDEEIDASSTLDESESESIDRFDEKKVSTAATMNILTRLESEIKKEKMKAEASTSHSHSESSTSNSTTASVAGSHSSSEVSPRIPKKTEGSEREKESKASQPTITASKNADKQVPNEPAKLETTTAKSKDSANESAPNNSKSRKQSKEVEPAPKAAATEKETPVNNLSSPAQRKVSVESSKDSMSKDATKPAPKQQQPQQGKQHANAKNQKGKQPVVPEVIEPEKEKPEKVEKPSMSEKAPVTSASSASTPSDSPSTRPKKTSQSTPSASNAATEKPAPPVTSTTSTTATTATAPKKSVTPQSTESLIQSLIAEASSFQSKSAKKPPLVPLASKVDSVFTNSATSSKPATSTTTPSSVPTTVKAAPSPALETSSNAAHFPFTSTANANTLKLTAMQTPIVLLNPNSPNNQNNNSDANNANKNAQKANGPHPSTNNNAILYPANDRRLPQKNSKFRQLSYVLKNKDAPSATAQSTTTTVSQSTAIQQQTTTNTTQSPLTTATPPPSQITIQTRDKDREKERDGLPQPTLNPKHPHSYWAPSSKNANANATDNQGHPRSERSQPMQIQIQSRNGNNARENQGNRGDSRESHSASHQRHEGNSYHSNSYTRQDSYRESRESRESREASSSACTPSPSPSPTAPSSLSSYNPTTLTKRANQPNNQSNRERERERESFSQPNLFQPQQPIQIQTRAKPAPVLNASGSIPNALHSSGAYASGLGLEPSLSASFGTSSTSSSLSLTGSNGNIRASDPTAPLAPSPAPLKRPFPRLPFKPGVDGARDLVSQGIQPIQPPPPSYSGELSHPFGSGEFARDASSNLIPTIAPVNHFLGASQTTSLQASSGSQALPYTVPYLMSHNQPLTSYQHHLNKSGSISAYSNSNSLQASSNLPAPIPVAGRESLSSSSQLASPALNINHLSSPFIPIGAGRNPSPTHSSLGFVGLGQSPPPPMGSFLGEREARENNTLQVTNSNSALSFSPDGNDKYTFDYLMNAEISLEGLHRSLSGDYCCLDPDLFFKSSQQTPNQPPPRTFLNSTTVSLPNTTNLNPASMPSIHQPPSIAGPGLSNGLNSYNAPSHAVSATGSLHAPNAGNYVMSHVGTTSANRIPVYVPFSKYDLSSQASAQQQQLRQQQQQQLMFSGTSLIGGEREIPMPNNVNSNSAYNLTAAYRFDSNAESDPEEYQDEDDEEILQFI